MLYTIGRTPNHYFAHFFLGNVFLPHEDVLGRLLMGLGDNDPTLKACQPGQIVGGREGCRISHENCRFTVLPSLDSEAPVI